MEKLYSVANKLEETSNGLLNDIRRRSSLNRMYEKQSLALKRKLVEERKKAYDAASRKEGEGKGGLGFLRDLFLLRFLRGRGRGGGGFGRGGGRPPVGPRGGLGISPRITPRNNIVPFSRGRVPTRLGGLSRVGPLAVLGTGLDFTSRLGSGQNILQASLGSGGGLAGALAGGAKGAALGSVAGPVGTLIGGIGGSILGGIAGGSIADFLSGANRRRSQELERVTMMSRETEFSRASDDFDVVLDKFEGNTAPMLKSMKGEGGEEGKMNMNIPGVTAPKTGGGGFWKNVRGILSFLAKEALIIIGLGLIPKVGWGLLAVRLTRMFSRFKVLMRLLRKLRPAIKATKKFAHKFIPKDSFFGLVIQRNNRIIARQRLNSRSWMKGRKNQIIQNEAFVFKPRQPKSVLFPERVTGFGSQGVLRQFTRGPLRTNVVRPRQDPYAYLKDLFKGIKKSRPLDPKVVNQNFADYIKKVNVNPEVLRKSLKNNPNLSALEAIQKQLRKEGSQFQKTKRYGSVDPTGTAKNMNVPPEVFKQEGGRVEAGRPYIVGEIGKELFVPDVSGEIIPNEDLPSSNLLVIDREPERIIIPQVVQGESDIVPMSSAPNPYDVVAKYAQMTGLFTV